MKLKNYPYKNGDFIKAAKEIVSGSQKNLDKIGFSAGSKLVCYVDAINRGQSEVVVNGFLRDAFTIYAHLNGGDSLAEVIGVPVFNN